MPDRDRRPDREFVREALRRCYEQWERQMPVTASLSTMLLDGPLSDPDVVAAISRGVARLEEKP